MKKEFNKIKPYVYWIKNNITGIKYIGVRWLNVKLNKTPIQDFGKTYFSSGKLEKDFKKNPENFRIKFLSTFDSVKEAVDFEKKRTKKVYKNKRYANIASYPAIINEIHPMLGKKHTEQTKLKLSKKATDRWKSENISQTMKKGFKKISEYHKGKPSGMLGKKHKEDVRERMSKSRMGNKSNTGRKLSEIHRKNIGKGLMGKPGTMMGKKHSKETKRRMSASHKGNKANLGNKASEATKLKMSLAQKKRFSNPNERSKMSAALINAKRI